MVEPIPRRKRMKLRVSTALLALLIVALFATQNAAAQTPSIGAYSVPITGKSTTGVPFAGVLKIERFAVNSTTNTVYAIGSITGSAGSTAVGTTRVFVPVKSLSSTAASSTAASTSPCPILNLTIGAIHLNLLGLVIDTNQIHLSIVAQPGSGNLLGNLLCDIANLLNNNGALTTLVQDLNALLKLL
jgi:hypothetical protein